MAAITLLIVDDHKLVRDGLRMFVMSIHDLIIVGEARNGLEAVELAAQLCPDVILMDLVMPKMDGIEATRILCQQNPQARILMITSFAEDERVMMTVQAGASGYLLKDSSLQELEMAIRTIARGEPYLPTNIMRKVIQNVQQPVKKQYNSLDDLTLRELEILRLVASGSTNEEIARALYLSPWTVRSHVWRIMKKLQLDNRTQVALYAVRSGMVAA